MGKNTQLLRCRYCGKALLSDGATCPDCGQRKQSPFFLQGEFWGLLVALAMSVMAFATALMR